MEQGQTLFDKYKQLWGESQQLDEDNPNELQMKLTIYGQLYEMTGKFHAGARADARMAKLERQEASEVEFMALRGKVEDGKKFSEKEREKKAFLATIEFHKKELEMVSEAERWESARSSVLEQINIMKKKQDVMLNLFQRANTVNN